MSLAATRQQAVLEGLRAQIRQLEDRPARRVGALGSGRPEIDELLGGGFPCGALSELAGGPASGKTALALSTIATAGQASAWIDGRGELYPPAARALGVDLSRLLIVRPAPGDPVAPLWAAEALLASGAFAVVVMDLSPEPSAPRRGASPEAMLRRLRAAAEKGGAVGLWLGPPEAPVRVPATVRLELAGGRARVGAGGIAGGLPPRGAGGAGRAGAGRGGGHAA
ncbi:ImuA family protein [Anaeromyxobacter paludicola]|uniref:Protein RecA n=1 Tax=Anaeromyxobacter paludicola TaxID=2918171 RepID=A0ABM7X7D6_9BACT|nr:hypothetical protein [Anaeromyxobacter paludicola]BDG07748.1 hypothetical protein AMPC_08610 [Anaeromyxobacter paludicola]